jgi:hypothetical protein
MNQLPRHVVQMTSPARPRTPSRPVRVVLLGHHGVGKTTTGRALAAQLGVPFHEEIGRLLAEDPSWRAGDGGVELAQPAFDDEVFRRELARDAQAPKLRIVETWHPGNLAYAEARSPAVARRRLPSVELATRNGRTLVVPLVAPPTVLAARQSEPGPITFYQAVTTRSLTWAAHLGLEILPAVSTHNQTPDSVARSIVATLGSLPWTASI